MKKYSFLIIIFAFIGMASSFTSCRKTEYITPAYFEGKWNLVKAEHLYMYDSGDKLVSHTITHDLVYDFAKDSVTILYDGQFIFKSPWRYNNGKIDMPVLHDDIVAYHYSPVWYIDEVSNKAFTASNGGILQTSDSVGNKIEYKERYTYYFEKKK